MIEKCRRCLNKNKCRINKTGFKALKCEKAKIPYGKRPFRDCAWIFKKDDR